ncbi:MAG: hypothetical protein QG650_986 [Patescibacteria group bacterium]|nr:hypothetical protein [Patescibacteria group bacterium]
MSGQSHLLPGRKPGQYSVHELHEVAGLVFRNPLQYQLKVRSEVSEVRELGSPYGYRNAPVLVLRRDGSEARGSGFPVLLVWETVDDRMPFRLHFFEEFGTLFGLVFPDVFQSRL